MLALKEIDSDYIGKNITPYVIEAIREYEIKKNLGYFVIDNANNNDTMLVELLLLLYRDYRITYNTIYYRLYY